MARRQTVWFWLALIALAAVAGWASNRPERPTLWTWSTPVHVRELHGALLESEPKVTNAIARLGADHRYELELSLRRTR